MTTQSTQRPLPSIQRETDGQVILGITDVPKDAWLVQIMSRLMGLNRINEFRETARRLTTEISSLIGVDGIIYTGGLARGFADKYSDVDIIVFLSDRSKKLREKIRKIGSDEQESSRIDVDLEIHYLRDFENRELDENRKWDFSAAEIVFDPYGRTKELLRSKTKVPKLFWIRRIVECGEYLKWFCCPPKEGTPTLTEMWIDRGDLVSAQDCLDYSLDLLLMVIFALNKELLPAPKWRVYYSYSLKWLPSYYRRLLEEVITARNLSIEDLNRRLKTMRKICADIFIKIEHETGLKPDMISKQYVKNVLNQI